MAELRRMVKALPPPARSANGYTVTKVPAGQVVPLQRKYFGTDALPPGRVVGLVLQHGDQPVGFATVGLHNVAEVSWLHVDRAHWGTGGADTLATEAMHVAHDAGYPDVHALVNPGNAASVKLVQRLGGGWF